MVLVQQDLAVRLDYQALWCRTSNQVWYLSEINVRPFLTLLEGAMHPTVSHTSPLLLVHVASCLVNLHRSNYTGLFFSPRNIHTGMRLLLGS